MPLPAGPTSSTPCGLARSVSHVGNPTSEPANENVVCANRAAHGKSPMPVKATVTTQPANPPRQLRQNVMLKRKWLIFWYFILFQNIWWHIRLAVTTKLQ